MHCALSSDAQQAERHAAHTHTQSALQPTNSDCSLSQAARPATLVAHQRLTPGGTPSLHLLAGPDPPPDQLFGRENASRQIFLVFSGCPLKRPPSLLVGQTGWTAAPRNDPFLPLHPPTLAFIPSLPSQPFFPTSSSLLHPAFFLLPFPGTSFSSIRFFPHTPSIVSWCLIVCDCNPSFSRVAHHGWQTSENKRAATHGVGGLCSPK